MISASSTRPWFEAVLIPEGQSCFVYDRRLSEFDFNWHYHPEYELTLTLGSRGTRFVGGHVAPYTENDLALIGPNLPHAWQSHDLGAGASEHRAVICWFTDEWIRALVDVVPELSPILPLLDEARRGVLFDATPEICARMIDLCTRPPPERTLRLLMILLEIGRQPDRRGLSAGSVDIDALPRDRQRMEVVLTYLHANLADPIRLAPLCVLAHVTESQLQRIFKRSTGLSISAYVARLRVGRAATLLVRTDYPLDVIAERCGFYDAPHMAKKFRNLAGTTPSSYRRDFRSRGEPQSDGVFPMTRTPSNSPEVDN